MKINVTGNENKKVDMMKEIEKATNRIIELCKEEGIIVHYYKSRTSDSMYLKFDYGVAHSLRISSHMGIEKYHYKFNLIKGIPKIYEIKYKNDTHSTYYPFKEFYQCVKDIVENRDKMIEKYNGFDGYMEEVKKIKEKIEKLPEDKLYPFWRYGKKGD